MTGDASVELVQALAFGGADRSGGSGGQRSWREVYDQIAESFRAWIEPGQLVRGEIRAVLEASAGGGGERPCEPHLHHRLDAGHGDEDGAAIVRDVGAAWRQPIDARRAVGFELRRPVVERPLVLPA